MIYGTNAPFLGGNVVCLPFSTPKTKTSSHPLTKILSKTKRHRSAGRQIPNLSGPCMDPVVKPRCFIKIIVSNITLHSRLMIPRKFMTTYGDDLADLIFLEAPDGSIWQVKLDRSDYQVWLQNGWPDFAAHYSICFGHLLVFRYEGNSHFHVIIMDKSATEVEYPLSATSHSENTYHITGLEKRKDVTNDDTGNKENFKNCSASSAQYTETDLACAKASHQVNKKALQVTSGAEHARALASAIAFRSKNPFFKIKMCPSYVSGRSLSVPRNFFTTHIKQDHCNVILQLPDGRAWPVKCRISRTAAKFSSGWNIFAKENSLVVGDVCVFELINCSKKLINVGIFPVARGPSF